MLTDDVIADMEAAVEACEAARSDLTAALAEADGGDPSDDALRAVGTALEAWRDGQQQFMSAVEASEASDVSTAAMLLKMNHGIDATEARRGLPGVPVEGADQNFDLDLSGTRGTVLMTAATEYVS
jgi:hypothetical protein